MKIYMLPCLFKNPLNFLLNRRNHNYPDELGEGCKNEDKVVTCIILSKNGNGKNPVASRDIEEVELMKLFQMDALIKDEDSRMT